MPRLHFTDRTVAAIVPPVRGQVDFFDERMPGFGLRVTERGHKAWIVMYRVSGRLRRLTLGPYPRLSLADTRSMAKLALAAAVRGNDPAADKQADRQADTFGQLATLYIEQHAKPKKRRWPEDQRILDREALPRWRTLKVKEISYHHVQQLLDGIVQRGAPIAANARWRFSLSCSTLPSRGGSFLTARARGSNALRGNGSATESCRPEKSASYGVCSRRLIASCARSSSFSC